MNLGVDGQSQSDDPDSPNSSDNSESQKANTMKHSLQKKYSQNFIPWYLLNEDKDFKKNQETNNQWLKLKDFE